MTVQTGGSKQTEDAVAEHVTVSHGEIVSTVATGDALPPSARRNAAANASLFPPFLVATQLSISPSHESNPVTT